MIEGTVIFLVGILAGFGVAVMLAPLFWYHGARVTKERLEKSDLSESEVVITTDDQALKH